MKLMESTWIGRCANNLWRGVRHLLFPNSCWACRNIMDDACVGFCPDCHAAITRDPAVKCPNCAGEVGPHSNHENGCVNCRKENFAFHRAFRLGTYENQLKDVILCMKHWNGEGLAEMIGRLWAPILAAQWRREPPDVLIPIPLHWRRRLLRGYNQSQVLAEEIAKHAQIRCEPAWIQRIRNTPRQALQPAPARRQNVVGAFVSGDVLPIRKKHVMLIDDVMATGATAHQTARTLLRHRPDRISVAVLARPSFSISM